MNVALAFALDLAVGDPRGLPHPVRVMGAAIARGERLARARIESLPIPERIAGAALAFSLVGGAFALTAATLALARRIDARLARVVEVVAAASTLATRDLLAEAHAVYRALCADDLPRARTRVARIVGRDTHALDAAGVARATIETLAESLCDGIAAPLVFLAAGGAPAAMAFKAASTLDSTIGHREAPYRYFGTAAARLDDVANFVPARLAALALALVAPLAGGSPRAAANAVFADAARHRSPNAGFPEAAMAGALGVRLGGPLAYDGVTAHAPPLNAAGREPNVADIARAMRLCLCASVALAVLAGFGARRE